MSCRFTHEETLTIALHYQSCGRPWDQLDATCEGNCIKRTFMFTFFLTFVYHKLCHRLCGRIIECWAPNFHDHRYSICQEAWFNASGTQDINIYFCPWSCIDCMQYWMSYPRSGTTNEEGHRRENFHQTEQAFFTHYGHNWGTRSQVLGSHCGLRGSVYFTNVSNNYRGMLSIGGLEE